MRSDQENAAGAWVDEIVKLFPEQAKREYSPKHSSASNPAERHIQNVENLAITLRMSVVERYGKPEFGADHDGRPWLLRHAARLRARYHVRAKGCTSYHDLNGCEYKGEVVLFIECVMFRVPKP